MRVVLLAVALSMAACSQPAEPPPATSEALTPDASSDEALLAALTPVVSAEIGQPISFELTTVSVHDTWAYVVGDPRQPDGAAMDWTRTALASRHENGVMDEGGATHVLLKQEDGAWRVVTHVIAPTDVAWLTWPQDYGVPPEVLGLPAN